MAVMLLLAGAHFGKGVARCWHIKDRIIAKAAAATGFGQDFTFAAPDHTRANNALWINDRDRANKLSPAVADAV